MNLNLNRFSVRAFMVLLTCEVLLVLLDAAISYGRLISNRAIGRLFNITREDSIPNWFASMQFLLIALVLWVIYLRVRELDTAQWKTRGWAFFAGVFLFLSIDDGSKLHERVGTWLHASADAGDSLAGILVESHLSYTWHIALGPIFTVIGLFLLVFCWRAFRSQLPKILFLTGLACLGLAQVMDFLEGINAVVEYVARILSVSSFQVHHFSKSAEEFLEMLGQTLLLVAFLRHLGEIADGWGIELKV